MTRNEITIKNRKIGPDHQPFVIAEIGINHEGNYKKCEQMIRDAHKAGAECVKMQYHILEDEMIKTDVSPGNAPETIWEIIERTLITHEEHLKAKSLIEELGMIYLCTPFGREAARRLREMGTPAYKIGSGECNNYPLIDYIAEDGKPIIISTGMNDIPQIKTAIDIIEKHGTPYAILQCTSLYPTPYEKVRLGALEDIRKHFPNAVIGLSDHSLGNYTCFGAVALGASILEKHFTSDKSWLGPDVPISIDPAELTELIQGSKAIHLALGGKKDILEDEQVTIDFAYATVVSIKDIKKGEAFSQDNIWVKRPGTGEILAKDFDDLIGKKAKQDIKKDTQIRRNWVEE
ncbi:MAG: polyhydroxyalkanoate biosynthesis repressor PhaR [Asgard group archaeon]|nr:polyhydroxyalkanoate biosynthesis repressor PhaR [Asgard group archaeon]